MDGRDTGVLVILEVAVVIVVVDCDGSVSVILWMRQ